MALRTEYTPDFAHNILTDAKGICTAPLYQGVENAFDLSVTY
jgi:hypothetical protein